MNVYQIDSLKDLLSTNPYPGRGIVVGKTADGKHAAVAYFIMGRSDNSRNRVFVEGEGGAIFTEPFDPARVKDPSLIIYAPIRVYENHFVDTDAAQTYTVYEGLKQGRGFAESLALREFEPDAPSLTPRISAMLTFGEGDFTYQMSILKSADPEGSACSRYTFAYPALAGVGQFLHTYMTDGNPLPTFCGEPERVAIPSDIDAFTEEIWNHLNEDNRISLYVRFVSLEDGTVQNRLINRFVK